MRFGYFAITDSVHYLCPKTGRQMIEITTFVFNPFQENTYVVWDSSGECAVVDAGNYSAADDRKLSDFISRNSLRPVVAVNTHGHIDHILGTGYVADTYGVPFALHGEDRFLVDAAPEHARLYGFEAGNIAKPTLDISPERKITFGDTTLEVIHTPGHTPGHVCLFEPHSRTLFTGDTLFRESIGRTDLPGGDYSWIMRSILERILPLGGDVRILPGHGPESTLGHEALYNPFITEVVQGEVNF